LVQEIVEESVEEGRWSCGFASVLLGAIAVIASSIGNIFGLVMSLPVKSPLPDFYSHAVIALALGLVVFVS
jgi:hypothetical protein